MRQTLFFFVVLVSTSIASALTLSEKDEAKVCVVVSAEVMQTDPEKRGVDADLQALRWAADDLVNYLSRLGGGEVSLGEKAVEGKTPIYVGVGPKVDTKVTSPFGDAYVVDVTDERVVLQGESPRAVHYAAAHFLHELGVRWYGPYEIGEYVPAKRDPLTIANGKHEETPSFYTRNVWSGRRWGLRNRLAGPGIAQGHAFYRLLGGRDRPDIEEHPEYYPVYNGKPIKHQANLSSQKTVDLFVKNVRAQLEKGTNWVGDGVGIGPDDGALLDERPESRAMDSGRIDPLIQLPSSTDRFIKFSNKIAEAVEADYPNAYFGFYVYSNHQMPPLTVKPHRMLRPIVAPITFNRYTSIGNPNAPTSMLLADYIEQWAEMCPEIGFYLYNFNLADTAMPFTRTLFWQITLPRMYDWGLRYATVESMRDNWHLLMPGNYVLARMLWDIEEDVTPELNAYYDNFFGPAADAMRRYDYTLEQAYETTSAYAGSTWSIHRILTPQVMEVLDAALDEAEAATAEGEANAMYAKRVGIYRHTLKFAEHWLGARDALNNGRLSQAGEHAEAFEANHAEAAKKYPDFYGKYALRYFSAYQAKSFKDAGRVAREGTVIHAFPDEWDAILDKDQVGIADHWYHPDRDIAGWGKLRTHTISLDENGYPFFRGLIWYRNTFKLPTGAKKSGKVHIWFGGVDDTATIWLNGKKLGTHTPGRLGPLDVDLTEAIDRDGENTLVVAISNTGITEIGTGGLAKPVFLYVPHGSGTVTKPGEGDKAAGPQAPLFGGE